MFFKCFEQCLSLFQIILHSLLHLNEVTRDLPITFIANVNDPEKVLQKDPLRVGRIKQLSETRMTVKKTPMVESFLYSCSFSAWNFGREEFPQ